jgi:2-C-methyl-D-erythritol 4-phosphate cytidylyltransferase
MSGASPVWVVVVAAGQGTRFGAKGPKVHQPLCGQTVLAWSCAAFFDHPRVVRVVLVHAAEDRAIELLPCRGDTRLICVSGGPTRTASVQAGVAAVRAAGAADDALVLVHDGARPCVSAAEIDAVIAAAEAAGPSGAVLALPVTDTLKRHADQTVQATVPREDLARALTPQAFPLGALQAALAAAPDCTDEAGAMERAGFAPRLVWGKAANLKITYADDLALAEFWLQRRACSA